MIDHKLENIEKLAMAWIVQAVVLFLICWSCGTCADDPTIPCINENSTFTEKIQAAFDEAVRQGYDTSQVSAQMSPEGVTFNCDTSKPSGFTKATSVNELTPWDVELMGAIGDSVTAGFGATRQLFNIATEYRGYSWSIGGDLDLERAGTLTNFIKKYNPDVDGFSVKTGNHDSSNAHLNRAASGAISQDILEQAKELVNMVQNEYNEFKDSWKVVTIWIGGNNLCDYCKNPGKHSAANYIESIKQALDHLKDNLPKTFVNLVKILDVTKLSPLRGLVCDLVHFFACDCCCSTSGSNTEMTKEAYLAYNDGLEHLIENGDYDTEEFAVVLQPFFQGAEMPYKDGKPDASYFALDCFHFSTKGHMELSVELWNNMLQPVGSKSTIWDIGNPLPICPTAPYYFYTRQNSKSVSAADNPNQNNNPEGGAGEGGEGAAEGNEATGLLGVLLGVGVSLYVVGAAVFLALVGIYFYRRRRNLTHDHLPLVNNK